MGTMLQRAGMTPGTSPELLNVHEPEIVGLYELGIGFLDAKLVGIPVALGQRLLDTKKVSMVVVLLTQPEQAASFVCEAPACSDGIDNDGDGLADFDPITAADPFGGTGDPGCRAAIGTREDAACQNGIDDDFGGGVDFDGGASLHGGVALAPADPNCPNGARNAEAPGPVCGLGAEIALALAFLRGARRRAVARES